MDSIKRIREDSNLKLRIRVRSGPRTRANSGRIRIRANSCEFEPASLVWTPTPPLAGRRTPRPGPARVRVCLSFLAGSGGPASRARSGAPHLFLWPLWLSAVLGRSHMSELECVNESKGVGFRQFSVEPDPHQTCNDRWVVRTFLADHPPEKNDRQRQNTL